MQWGSCVELRSFVFKSVGVVVLHETLCSVRGGKEGGLGTVTKGAGHCFTAESSPFLEVLMARRLGCWGAEVWHHRPFLLGRGEV